MCLARYIILWLFFYVVISLLVIFYMVIYFSNIFLFSKVNFYISESNGFSFNFWISSDRNWAAEKSIEPLATTLVSRSRKKKKTKKEKACALDPLAAARHWLLKPFTNCSLSLSPSVFPPSNFPPLIPSLKIPPNLPLPL